MHANDLTYREWLDLGRVCTQLNQVGGCPFMGKKEE